jgi:ADP-ribose pyrophosphatase YjhB (NUDIX family)
MFSRFPVKHCRNCGAATSQRLPDDGDTKLRAVCTACATIHYENPLNVVGTVPWIVQDGVLKVLLCQRNIEPRKGKWTLPAGFMELAETTAEGALRETQEEAGAQIEMGSLITLMNVARVGQVHFFYRARLLNTVFDPGEETQALQLVSAAQVPWDELAFHTVRETLQRFFAEGDPVDQHAIHCIDL